MSFDVAIVGGGLAGSCMAFTLMQKGKSVLLVDEPSLSGSSKIAAGIYNPVVFKRTTLAWRAAEMLETCRKFYDEIETATGAKFHYPVPFYRFFSGYEEQNEWMMRSAQESFSPFLSDQLLPAPKHFTAPYNTSVVLLAGWVSTTGFMQAMRQQLALNGGQWIRQKFNPDGLLVNENGFEYAGFSFGKIVFCEGHLVSTNPWFGAIPLFPVKGEVLELETESLPENHVYNGAAYMLVMPGGKVKLGSTYDWQNHNDIPTEAGKQELLEKLETFYTGAKKVVYHAAGVRPAARDRRPVIGEHPSHKNMYVLNGLGAKGVSQGPWCAQQLYACMYNGEQPPKEVALARYIKQ